MAGTETSGAIAHPEYLFWAISLRKVLRKISQSPCWDSELSENSSEVLRDLNNSTLLAKNLCTQNWKLSILVARSTACK